jgi:hypothetical protein
MNAHNRHQNTQPLIEVSHSPQKAGRRNKTNTGKHIAYTEASRTHNQSTNTRQQRKTPQTSARAQNNIRTGEHHQSILANRDTIDMAP